MVEDAPFGADDAPKKGRPAKGSPEAAAWGRRMADGRAKKKAEREAAAGRSSSTPRNPSNPAAASPSITPTQVAADVEDGLRKLALMLTVPAPIPAVYVSDTSAELAGIVGRMAERNPKLLAALEGSSNLMDYVALGAWGLGLVAAVGVQVGRINADAPIARVTGVTGIVGDLEKRGEITVTHPGEPTLVPDEPVTEPDIPGAFDVHQAFTDPDPIIAPVDDFAEV